jgi:drug/metabolite transporter (DMT)-like permease
MGEKFWGWNDSVMKNFTSSLSFVGLLIATGIWGSTFFVIKDTLNTIHPVTLVAYRFAIAAAIFFLIVYIRKEKFWAHAKHGVILGLFVWSIYTLQTLGLQYTTASNSGFITGLFIVFVPLFGLLFFKRKPKVMQLSALAIALVGLWFLTGGLKSINIGDILTLLTAIGIGLNILVIDKFVKEKKSVAVLCFQQFFTTAILSFATVLIFGLPLAVEGTRTLFPIIYLAVFGSVIAQGLQLLSQRGLQPLTSSLLLSTEPIFAALFAWTLGNETFVLASAIGGLFVVIAIFISEIPINAKQEKKILAIE